MIHIQQYVQDVLMITFYLLKIFVQKEQINQIFHYVKNYIITLNNVNNVYKDIFKLLII